MRSSFLTDLPVRGLILDILHEEPECEAVVFSLEYLALGPFDRIGGGGGGQVVEQVERHETGNVGMRKAMSEKKVFDY